MGQKSNLLSLTKHTTSLNCCNLNSKLIILRIKSISFFEKFLINKNLNIFKINSLTVNNLSFISFNIFFRSKKLTRIKKKKTKKKLFIRNKFSKIFNITNYLNYPSIKAPIYLSVYNLNYAIKKNLLIKFYKNLQRYRVLYFQRVFNLFIDFIKVCALLCQDAIQGKNFLLFLSLIFKSISKKLHIRFIYFIKKVFKLILKNNMQKSNSSKWCIKGFKFIISGRLRDKQRSSFICLQEGVIPISNLKFGVDFSKLNLHTIYGVFGFKLWIFKDIL